MTKCEKAMKQGFKLVMKGSKMPVPVGDTFVLRDGHVTLVDWEPGRTCESSGRVYVKYENQPETHIESDFYPSVINCAVIHESGYKIIDRNGELIICDPGKFENEPLWIAQMWDNVLNGGAAEEYRDTDEVMYALFWVQDWDELMESSWLKEGQWVVLWESDSGFVHHCVLDSDEKEAWVRDNDKETNGETDIDPDMYRNDDDIAKSYEGFILSDPKKFTESSGGFQITFPHHEDRFENFIRYDDGTFGWDNWYPEFVYKSLREFATEILDGPATNPEPPTIVSVLKVASGGSGSFPWGIEIQFRGELVESFWYGTQAERDEKAKALEYLKSELYAIIT
jgi:hypothetical protein